jgi:hypothetical protein
VRDSFLQEEIRLLEARNARIVMNHSQDHAQSLQQQQQVLLMQQDHLPSLSLRAPPNRSRSVNRSFLMCRAESIMSNNHQIFAIPREEWGAPQRQQQQQRHLQ